MRDLSVMELEQVSGAGWIGDLLNGMGESVNQFFISIGQPMADTLREFARIEVSAPTQFPPPLPNFANLCLTGQVSLIMTSATTVRFTTVANGTVDVSRSGGGVSYGWIP